MLGSWLLGWKGRDTGLCPPAAALFLYASDFVAVNSSKALGQLCRRLFDPAPARSLPVLPAPGA